MFNKTFHTSFSGSSLAFFRFSSSTLFCSFTICTSGLFVNSLSHTSRWRVVEQQDHQRHVVATPTFQTLVEERLDSLFHRLVGPLRLRRRGRADEEVVHDWNQLGRVRKHVPYAVARKHDVVVLLASLADHDIGQAGHFLRLWRKIASLLVCEVAEGASDSQVSVHSPVENDSSRLRDALLLIYLRFTSHALNHIEWLVIFR